MSSITELKARARQIREATMEGENTALRVGSLFADIVDRLEDAGVDSSLTITPYYDSGVKIAAFNQNGDITTIYAPNGGSGGGGGSYDDTEIWNAVNELDSTLDRVGALADSEKTRLDGVIADIDSNIKARMQDAIDFASWIQGNFPEGDITYKSGWDEKTKEFMQTVGLWEQNAQNPVVTTTTWSNLIQRVNGIAADVTSLSTGGEFTSEMIQAYIDASVADGLAGLNLGTLYASKDAESVIEWMYSALKSNTSAEKTFTQIVSAGKSGLNSAISEVRTYVEAVKNGDVLDYVAVADLETKVNDAISGLYSSASKDDATVTLFSQVKKDASQVDSLATFIAEATNNYSNATIGTKFGTWSSGIITSTKLGAAVTSLIASHQSGDDVNSAVIRLIANNMGNQIEITTDMLTLSDGDTLGGLIFTSNSIAFFNACYEMHEVSGKYLNPTTRKPTDSSVGAQSILYTETRLSYNNVGTETCVLNGHFNPFELVYGNTMYDEYGVTISNSSNSVLAKLSSEGLTVSGNELSSNGLSLTSGSQIEISGSGGNLQIYLSNSGLDIGNTTYADDEIITQSAFTIGPATFNNSTLALSTNALTFGNFQIQNVTIGSSIYLRISTGGTTGLYMDASGRLGINDNNTFKVSFDMAEYHDHHSNINSLGDFLTNAGSDLSNYTIRNGLIVSA